MQALIFAATTGVGLFLGTQLAGIAMDRYSCRRQVPVAEDMDRAAGGDDCGHAGIYPGL